MITRPMLAVVVEPKQLSSLRYPQCASIKFDGIRCLMHPALGPVSRSFKPLANIRVRERLEKSNLDYMDGEILLYGEDGNPLGYNTVQSFVNSDVKSLPSNWNMVYHVFDDFEFDESPYLSRYGKLGDRIHPGFPHVELVRQEMCHNEHEVVHYYEKCLDMGHEGIMVRSPDAPYKSGRSTLREQFLLKLKPYHDDKGVITSVLPMETNQNVPEKDMFGLTKRSSSKSGKHQVEMVGKLEVHTEQWGAVKVSCGKMTKAQKQKLWKDRENLIGRTITFRYQSVGMLDKPRFSRFVRLEASQGELLT